MQLDQYGHRPWRIIVRTPMLRLTVPFMLGITLAMAAPEPLDLGSATPFLLLLLLFPLPIMHRWGGGRYAWMSGVLLSSWFLVFGALWCRLTDPTARPDHFIRFDPLTGPWVAEVTAVNGVTAHAIRADARILAQVGTGGIRSASGPVMMTLLFADDVPAITTGSRLVIAGEIEQIHRVPDPGGFDRSAWAASRGMTHELFAPPGHWSIQGHGSGWTDPFRTAREEVSAWLASGQLPARERAIVKALVLGQRDELDADQRTAFARSGTIHVLAVSGMHVGLIYLVLVRLMTWMGGARRARVVRGFLVLLLLWGYAGLTGGSPSVLRATVMFSMFTLSTMWERRPDALNSLFFAGFVLLLWEPLMLVQAGFQLSFLAVLGILLFQAPLEGLWRPGHRWLGWIWSLMVLSMTAQILTTPLSIHLFKAFPVWFLPANLVVVTVVSLVVQGSLLLLLVQAIPLVGDLVAYVVMLMLKLVGGTTAFFAELPGAYPDIRIAPITVMLLYVTIFAGAARWRWGSRPMGLLALAALGCILVVWAYSAHLIAHRTTFTVYDGTGETWAAMQHGRDLVVLCDPDSFPGKGRLVKKVERHSALIGGGAPQFLSADSLLGGRLHRAGSTFARHGRWVNGPLDVIFHRGGYPVPDTIFDRRSDVLVLSDMQYTTEREIHYVAQAALQVVLAGGIPFRVRQKLIGSLAQRSVTFHDVRTDGAFVLEKSLER